MKKIKISAVSYLNTKPFLYGLEQSRMQEQLDIQLDIPAECARKLVEGEVDLGLVPVAVIPQLKEAHLVSDYCIGANGPVKTVSVFSDCPLEEAEAIYLDYQSRTSVALLKILLEKYWNITPTLLQGQKNYEQKTGGKTAALVIGDRAIKMDQKHSFVYDLSYYWKEMTGLPFVFAAWVSRQSLPSDFVQSFNVALKTGLTFRSHLAENLISPDPQFSLKDYYFKYIDYSFTSKKYEALRLFLHYISPEQSRPFIPATGTAVKK